ncbi:MAG: ferredoxin family protein [Dehalococcoidia bacterium]|jgi:NAD-dependent dihydropyrimidine dehydrogenase PreA subunit|nr:ferredoxin family protein [Dehalococcoidia bacterium]MDW8008117.1 ferredoxin family protein [Chloroflexota bacterium]HXG42628.1 ferredoxin family protein [Dehalococcoidia bacterium]
MAYVICEPCIDVMDKSCVEVCPVDCIHYEEGVDRKLYIDPDECIDCGACEPVCPVTAIFAEDDVPDQWKEYIELDAKWYKDPDAVRARINELKPA